MFTSIFMARQMKTPLALLGWYLQDTNWKEIPSLSTSLSAGIEELGWFGVMRQYVLKPKRKLNASTVRTCLINMALNVPGKAPRYVRYRAMNKTKTKTKNPLSLSYNNHLPRSFNQRARPIYPSPETTKTHLHA